MRDFRHVLVLLLLGCLVPGAAVADGPIRRAASENERFHMLLIPGQPNMGAHRGCRATLYERETTRERGAKRWDRFLVSEVAPERIFIHDSGRWVVTLGEYRRGGACHALVIYGADGALLRHFLLADLLNKTDWQHVATRGQSVDWLKDATVGFEANRPRFVIRLPHGRRISIDLNVLAVVPENGRQMLPGAMPVQLAALLYGEDAVRDWQAALASQTERAASGAAASTSEADTAEAALHEAEAVDETEVIAEADAAGEAAPDEVAADAECPADEPAPDADEPALEMPAPDPLDPVDYVAWVNAQHRIDGLNAADNFDIAIELMQPWEGDGEVHDAAQRGDPAALGDPAVQQWLADNAEALAYWRSGRDLPFAGWELHSNSGWLISALLPNVASMRQLAKTSVMDGHARALAGDWDGAADSYLSAAAVGAQLSEGPTLIETLVGVAVQALAADAFLDFQATQADAEVDYARLAEQAADEFRPIRSLAETTRFEQAAFYDVVQRTYRADPDTGELVFDGQALLDDMPDLVDPAERANWAAEQAQFSFEEVIAQGDAYYDEVTEALSLPFPAARERLAEIERTWMAPERDDVSPLLRMFTPSLSRVASVKTRSETMRRGAQLVTQLNAYRQQHGEYPASLDIFGNAAFVQDPFSTQAFRYVTTKDGFTLYSAGENGVDDGGIHAPRADTHDYVIWPRPE